MALLGNIIWWLTGSVLASLVWFLIGCLMFATVIGAPFGRASFTIARLCLSPFGKDVVSTAELRKAKAHLRNDERLAQGNLVLQSVGGLAQLIWFPFGLFLAFGHLATAVALFCTIFLIPLGIQHFKIAVLSLVPVGKRVVTQDMARIIREANATQQLIGS